MAIWYANVYLFIDTVDRQSFILHIYIVGGA